MTHTYKIDDTLICIIYNDEVEVGAVGPWADEKSAENWGKDVVSIWNDTTRNPNNLIFPEQLNKPAETPADPTIIPNG